MLTSQWRKRGLNKNKNMKTFSQFLEAAGDPVRPEQSIKLDAEAQRNLRNAMRPSGPAPMQSPKPAPKQDKVKNFIQRMRINTMFSPL